MTEHAAAGVLTMRRSRAGPGLTRHPAELLWCRCPTQTPSGCAETHGRIRAPRGSPGAMGSRRPASPKRFPGGFGAGAFAWSGPAVCFVGTLPDPRAVQLPAPSGSSNAVRREPQEAVPCQAHAMSAAWNHELRKERLPRHGQTERRSLYRRARSVVVEAGVWYQVRVLGASPREPKVGSGGRWSGCCEPPRSLSC